MPRSRKRHHSRSRSKTRSRSHSPDSGHEKQKKPNSHEKDGKRRRLDEAVDSPQQKRSLSDDESIIREDADDDSGSQSKMEVDAVDVHTPKKASVENSASSSMIELGFIYDKTDKAVLNTPKKALTPKQLQKRLESEKKRQQKQIEREEREKQRQEEKAKALAEKQKIKEQKEAEKQRQLEEKQRQLEVKQKEKELKRREKEEQEAQKEQERLKKLQEIEEKNKEKQKEEEKKQKSAAFLKKFFKKPNGAEEREHKPDKTATSNFMPFEVKSDMKLPPARRSPLTPSQVEILDSLLAEQNTNASYLMDLKTGKIVLGKSSKTWPYSEDSDEVIIVDEEKALGETISEDTSVVHKTKAKFLSFYENRRPPYYGTWRKKSKFVRPRRPWAEDIDMFNYEEDSDDDWEDEEQGESLEASADDEDKDNEEDEYEVDNDFFVPHGHLSDDEVDEEPDAPLSPEALKQKLKLLKDEFEEDHNAKTRKLKPRSIGVVWFDKDGSNVDKAIFRYLKPFAMIVDGPKEIKNRPEMLITFNDKRERRTKPAADMPPEHVQEFLKIINHNCEKQRKIVVEQFLAHMTNKGVTIDTPKAQLLKLLKESATYKRCVGEGPLKNKFGWTVNADVKEKYAVNF